MALAEQALHEAGAHQTGAQEGNLHGWLLCRFGRGGGSGAL
jgi:hypothetical protein